MGHGHVIPNPDGTLARCGGLAICSVCKAEMASLSAGKVIEIYKTTSKRQFSREEVGLQVMLIDQFETSFKRLGDKLEKLNEESRFYLGPKRPKKGGSN